jgi:hypothetical protein
VLMAELCPPVGVARIMAIPSNFQAMEPGIQHCYVLELLRLSDSLPPIGLGALRIETMMSMALR